MDAAAHNEALGVLMVIGFLFLFVLAVLWFLLPFAIFGTKTLLREHIAATKALAAKLDEMNRLLCAQAPGRSESSPSSNAR